MTTYVRFIKDESGASAVDYGLLTLFPTLVLPLPSAICSPCGSRTG
jgi:hypothetical protein